MADMDDKDKQQYSYRPEIEYQDTYESEHANKGYQSVDASDSGDDGLDKDIIDSISKDFNDVTKIMPLLPADLQTVINGVYRPILDSWANLEKPGYPKIIHDPDETRWVIPGRTPGTIDPTKTIDPFYPDYPDPTPGTNDIDDYIVKGGGIWDIDFPMGVEFPEVDPIEVIKREYIKNIADLYDFYVNRLKDILYHYYSERLSATFGKKVDKDGKATTKSIREVGFLFAPITDNCGDVEEQHKHLFDASVAMSEKTKLKINFLSNVCPVEQTLFHLKNFGTIQQLRLRYANIDAIADSNRIDAMNNRILKALKTSYDKKYDVAFMDLYKYLNGSLDILEDVINTDLAGLKARRTLIEKGGIKK